MFFKDYIDKLINSSEVEREDWLEISGFFGGISKSQKEKMIELFNQLLNNWSRYEKFISICEYMLPMIRQAASYLDIDGNMPYTVKSNNKKVFVYNYNFDLDKYLEHFHELFNVSSDQFLKIFINIDVEAELCHLCIRDYFYSLAKSSKVELYDSIVREINIDKII
jgi:hypothetical protein